MKPKIPDTAKKVFQGITFSIWQWEQEQFDGSFKTFEMASRRDSATMIVVLENNKILISEEEQPGGQKFISLPAGELEEGEELLLGAQRELREETGYTGGDWEIWYESGLGTKISYANYFYIVKGAKKTNDQELDPGGEKIIVKEISLDELVELRNNPLFRNRDIFRILEKMSDNVEYKEEIRKKLWGTV
jgi:ADP-ribose pyrophosphatase